MTNWQFETKLIHSGYDGDKETGATALPIYQTTSFQHDTAQELSDIFNNRQFGYTYSRIANPTVTALENKVNALENGRGAVALASGMGAISVVFHALVEAGDEIITSKSLFGGTYYLLKELEATRDIKVHWVEATDNDAYRAHVNDKTRLIFCETIGNPKLDTPDIQTLADIANEANIPLIVDSTSTTPQLIDLKALGAHVVVHSATKWMGGNGTTLGGLIVDTGLYDWTQSFSTIVKQLTEKMGEMGFLARCRKLRSNMGAPLSPLNAFLLYTGIETMALRLDKQCENASKVAQFLQGHPKVTNVSYLELESHPCHAVAKAQFKGKYGSVVTFELATKKDCFKWIDSLKLIRNLANLGDAKTLAIHPESTIYRDLPKEEKDEAGALQTLIRLSIGIESDVDIINDIKQALEAIG